MTLITYRRVLAPRPAVALREGPLAARESLLTITILLRRDPQAHRNHRRFNETVTSEKFLRKIFRPVGQQRDAKKIFLLRKIDGVVEQL